MRVIGHETVRVELNAVSNFVFQEQIVIQAFGGIGLHQPGLIVALPGDVKDRVIAEHGVSGKGRHVSLQSKFNAKFHRIKNP